MRKYVSFLILLLIAGYASAKEFSSNVIAGFGILKHNPKKEYFHYNNYRILLQLDPCFNIIDKYRFSFNIDGSFELSYAWRKKTNLPPNINKSYSSDIGFVVDIHPTLHINSKVIVPGISGGLSFGFKRVNTTNQIIHPSLGLVNNDIESHFSLIGYCLKPQFSIIIKKFIIKEVFNFRHFYGNKSESLNEEKPVNLKHNQMSFSIANTLGFQQNMILFSTGLRLEKWLYKLKSADEWPKWDNEWEFIPFVGIHIR
jgi:hypothetical protein